MLVIIVAGLIAGFVLWRNTADEIPDFSGAGDTEVIVRVQSGDGIGDIATTLTEAGVVASPEAFQNQAALDADVQALRPGYYKVRQNASAQATADALVAKENHVGQGAVDPRPATGRRHRGVHRSERGADRRPRIHLARSPRPPACR